MEIWINPACSKCRAATKALDGAGVDYTVRRYLDDPPTAEELDAVLTRLSLDPWHLVRHNEPDATSPKTSPTARTGSRPWSPTPSSSNAPSSPPTTKPPP